MSLHRSPLRCLVLATVAMGAACQTDRERPGTGEAGASASTGGDPVGEVRSGPGSGFGPRGEWVLTPTRVGPVEIGASFEAVRPHLEEPSPDAASPSDDCRIVRPADRSAGLTLMVYEGRIVRADVTDGPTTTTEGARVGDTEARLLELYPDARRQPHKYTAGSYLVAVPLAPADTLHRYVFETDGAWVTRFRAGIYPQVEWVEGCS